MQLKDLDAALHRAMVNALRRRLDRLRGNKPDNRAAEADNVLENDGAERHQPSKIVVDTAENC